MNTEFYYWQSFLRTDWNMDRAEYDKENVILRATQKGKPDYVSYEVNGTNYKAVKVDNCIYIPDIEAIM